MAYLTGRPTMVVGRLVGLPTGHCLWPVIFREVACCIATCQSLCNIDFLHYGPSNPCDACVATCDWTSLLLLGSKGVIALHFQPKTGTHKILQEHVEIGDLLAI